MLTKDDLQQIGTVVQNQIQKELEPIKKDLSEVKKKVTRIEKTVNIMVKAFDEEEVRLHKRVTKIEQHLGFPKN